MFQGQKDVYIDHNQILIILLYN